SDSRAPCKRATSRLGKRPCRKRWGRGSKSLPPCQTRGALAQRAERRADDGEVPGASPGRPTNRDSIRTGRRGSRKVGLMTLRLSILTSSTSSRSSEVEAAGASLDQRCGEARAVNGVGRPAVGEWANQ